MDVIPLLVFCSLALAGLSAALFIYSTRNRDHEHADRLALLPLDEDLGQTERRAAPDSTAPGNTAPGNTAPGNTADSSLDLE